MDNFETLSNDDLRKQLVQHGLGNFPVTNTTRNLLIRKLRESISGGPKAKARRETVHIVKQDDESGSDVDANVKKSKAKPATNRRATIGVAAAPVSAPEPVIAPPKVTARSKSGRITPKVVSTPLAEFVENSDDEIVVTKPSNRNKSRSPSLGKSVVVTTSYKQTISPLYEQHDDDDVIVVNEESDTADEDINRPVSTSHDIPIYRTQTTFGDTADRRATLDTFKSKRFGTSLLDKNVDKPFESNPSTDLTYRRRFTTNTAQDYSSSHVNGHENKEEDPLNNIETPFLSDFTRRLAQLRAEPLSLKQTFDYEQPSKEIYRPEREYRAYNLTTTSSRYSYLPVEKKKPESTLKKLEQKLRWPLLGFVILFGVVLIYVFLFTN